MPNNQESDNYKTNSTTPNDLSKWMHQGKPLKVLSTSLGVALALNLILAPIGPLQIVKAEETATSTPAVKPTDTTTNHTPTLVEWSNDNVKKYFDASTDWSLPSSKKPEDDKEAGSGDSGKSGGSSGTGSNTVIVNNGGGGFGGGFGWDDLLLYHLIFNSGRPYSSNTYYNNRPVYVAGTQKPYTAKSFNTQSFQNKPVAGSAYAPHTSVSDGSITRRSSSNSSSAKSTSSQPGGIGGKSSGVSSSSSSSSSKSSSSGSFGG